MQAAQLKVIEPGLKHFLQTVKHTAIPWWVGPSARLFSEHYQETPCLIVHWEPKTVHRALTAVAIKPLSEKLKTCFEETTAPGWKTLYWVMGSAGADVKAPFESLTALNVLLQDLWLLRLPKNLSIEGVLEEPLGTYGGASLLLASVCKTIWCERLNSFHLVG